MRAPLRGALGRIADHARPQGGDDHGEDAASAVVAIHREVPRIQAGQVAGLDVTAICLRSGVGIAGQLQRSAA